MWLDHHPRQYDGAARGESPSTKASPAMDAKNSDAMFGPNLLLYQASLP